MRRLFLVLLFSLLCGSAYAKPNIVVILTDDQEDTGSIAYMPKLQEAIAQQGITFQNSFVNFPLCGPSRASFMTGQLAHNNGVESNHSAWNLIRRHEDNTLPVWLQEAGFTTALIGKYINSYDKENPDKEAKRKTPSWYTRIALWVGEEGATKNTTPPPGWDLWFANVKDSYYGETINENGKLIKFGEDPGDYSTTMLQDRAVRFIKEQTDSTKPFFLFIAPKAPHGQGDDGVKGPAIPSPSHQHDFADVKLPPSVENNPPSANQFVNGKSRDPEWKRGDENAYRAELQSLQSVDDLVEAVVAELKSSNKLDNTVIIYTSDNGFVFGVSGREGKKSPYEGAIKVPLLMRGPGIPENETRRQLVNNLDVVATIVELAGATPGVPLDGHSLVPLFNDPNAPWRSAILVELGSGDSVRTETRKYVGSSKTGEEAESLYDLTADPDERTNKVGDPSYADDLVKLRGLYASLKSCAGASCWIATH